jgi:hypothetical protein
MPTGGARRPDSPNSPRGRGRSRLRRCVEAAVPAADEVDVEPTLFKLVPQWAPVIGRTRTLSDRIAERDDPQRPCRQRGSGPDRDACGGHEADDQREHHEQTTSARVGSACEPALSHAWTLLQRRSSGEGRRHREIRQSSDAPTSSVDEGGGISQRATVLQVLAHHIHRHRRGPLERNGGDDRVHLAGKGDSPPPAYQRAGGGGLFRCTRAGRASDL